MSGVTTVPFRPAALAPVPALEEVSELWQR